jgi:hypothetical protein
MVVWMSSVTVPVATPPTWRSAAVRSSALVPHQKAACQRFFPGMMAR